MSLNKLLAALLVIVFVFFGLAILLVWSVQDNLLNADSYIEALDRADFFDVPYQLIRDGNIPQAGGLLLQEGPLSVVSGPELEEIARELAPPDWLRAQMERAIRDFIDVVDSPESEELPGVLLSLREVKARALSEPGDRALSIVVQALPVCAPGRAPLDMNSDTPVCTPADIPLSSFVGRLKSLLEPLDARTDTYHELAARAKKAEDLRRAGRTPNQPHRPVAAGCFDLALGTDLAAGCAPLPASGCAGRVFCYYWASRIVHVVLPAWCLGDG
jgi:hypothetical protein